MEKIALNHQELAPKLPDASNQSPLRTFAKIVENLLRNCRKKNE